MRLLSVAPTNRPFTKVAKELLHFTWGGFVIAVTTGFLLFLPNASRIAININLQVKMSLIVLAGINMFIFEFVTARNSASRDTGAITNAAGRPAAPSLPTTARRCRSAPERGPGAPPADSLRTLPKTKARLRRPRLCQIGSPAPYPSRWRMKALAGSGRKRQLRRGPAMTLR